MIITVFLDVPVSLYLNVHWYVLYMHRSVPQNDSNIKKSISSLVSKKVLLI